VVGRFAAEPTGVGRTDGNIYTRPLTSAEELLFARDPFVRSVGRLKGFIPPRRPATGRAFQFIVRIYVRVCIGAHAVRTERSGVEFPPSKLLRA